MSYTARTTNKELKKCWQTIQVSNVILFSNGKGKNLEILYWENSCFLCGYVYALFVYIKKLVHLGQSNLSLTQLP